MENRISIIVPVISPYLGMEEFCSHLSKSDFSSLDIIFVDGSIRKNDFIRSNIEVLQGHCTYIHAPGSNIFDAMNIGAEASQSRWLFFCGLDDQPMIDEDFFEALAVSESINSEIALWCFVSLQPFGIYRLFCFFLILLSNFNAYKIKNYGMIISHQDMIFKKDKFLQSGGYNSSLRFTADFDLFVKYCNNRMVTVKKSSKLLCKRGISGVSSRADNRLEIINSFLNTLSAYGEKPSFFLLLIKYLAIMRGNSRGC